MATRTLAAPTITEMVCDWVVAAAAALQPERQRRRRPVADIVTIYYSEDRQRDENAQNWITIRSQTSAQRCGFFDEKCQAISWKWL